MNAIGRNLSKQLLMFIYLFNTLCVQNRWMWIYDVRQLCANNFSVSILAESTHQNQNLSQWITGPAHFQTYHHVAGSYVVKCESMYGNTGITGLTNIRMVLCYCRPERCGMFTGSMNQSGVNEDMEILRRQQRGRELALLDEPSKVFVYLFIYLFLFSALHKIPWISSDCTRLQWNTLHSFVHKYQQLFFKLSF